MEINMSEKEIPISESSSVASEDDDVQLPGKGADLSSELKDGASQQDVLDFVLQQPEDKLIPWEETELPSRGLYYGDSIPGGIVEVKGMGLHAEKILATQRLAQSGYSLDYLFRHCVRFPNSFDPMDLLEGDRIFLLYYIRGITHGQFYEFVMTCPNTECQAMSTHTFDLNELYTTVKTPETNETEPFTIDLPYLTEATGRRFFVKVRYLRGRDSQAMWDRRKFMQKVSGGEARSVKGKKVGPQRQVSLDQSIEENLNLLIVEAMGDTSPSKIQQLVLKLHARDTATIREFIQGSPGIDTNIKVDCPSCQNEITADLPITPSFFRPTKSRGDGT